MIIFSNFKVEKLLKEYNEQRFGSEKQPVKPLIRLKVDYTEFETINEIRFAQKFVETVANPQSILQFTKYEVCILLTNPSILVLNDLTSVIGITAFWFE